VLNKYIYLSFIGSSSYFSPFHAFPSHFARSIEVFKIEVLSTLSNWRFKMESQNHNGRITAKQEVQRVRANQPSREAPFGEFWDNSICWGQATKIINILSRGSIVVVDDGRFASEHDFATMWQKTKLGHEARYDEANKAQLGKYNAGATDSVISLGGLATAFHNFNGVVKKIIFDVSSYQRDDKISAQVENASQQETADFKKYMRLMDPNYTLESGRGTCIKIQSLCNRNTPSTVKKVIKFAKGLYTSEATNCTISIYNWLNDEWPSNPSPTQVISPIDITFGAAAETILVTVCEDEQGERKHCKSGEEVGASIHTYEIKYWILNEEQRCREQTFYGYTSDQERIGFSVYRANRNVTHLPKLWGLSTGMSRARGIRLAVFIPASEEGDKIFGIGTQKLLTNDSWSHFDLSMKNLFAEKFGDLQKMVDACRKTAQKEWIKKYKELLDAVPNLDADGANVALVSAKVDIDTNYNSKDGIIKVKRGAAWDAYNNYEKALESHIASLEESEATSIDDESSADEGAANAPPGDNLEDAQIAGALATSLLEVADASAGGADDADDTDDTDDTDDADDADDTDDADYEDAIDAAEEHILVKNQIQDYLQEQASLIPPSVRERHRSLRVMIDNELGKW
jgi:hypothetical protein